LNQFIKCFNSGSALSGRISPTRINELAKHAQKPPYFEQVDVLFWTDPHIAQQMLATHLDPTIEAASRIPDKIDKTVRWLIDQLKLTAGSRLLDLGCGPGLYCKRFADQGIDVTGIDFSENSIQYARTHDPVSRYRCQNYLTLEPFDTPFDAVTLIYGDYCVLRDTDRARLLASIHSALTDDGIFAFDVTTRAHFTRQHSPQSWYVADKGGFWKSTPHMVLVERFDYPEQDTFLDQYQVIEETGTLTTYRNWFQCFTLETITAELAHCGFDVIGAYSDLLGTPYHSGSEWIGILCRKVR
jgi:SAM-dependent methyltransferase